MEGIAHPILWKSSPNKTEMAIISKGIHGEESLSKRYLDGTTDIEYSPPPTAELCYLAIKIVEILERIHAKRVRHGSLRPDVIGLCVVNGETQVCIRDFTESRIMGESETPLNTSPPSESLHLNFPPSVCLHYLSPETISGIQPGFPPLLQCLIVVDHRSDFYSLGAILHHLLTGKPLFSEYIQGGSMSSKNALEVAVAQRSQSAISPTSGREPLLDELVLRLLQKLPNLRYQTGIQEIVNSILTN